MGWSFLLHAITLTSLESGFMFLICHVTSRDRMIKGLCYFIGEVSYGCNVPLCHVGGYWLCASGDIKYLMSCDFIKPQDRRVM